MLTGLSAHLLINPKLESTLALNVLVPLFSNLSCFLNDFLVYYKDNVKLSVSIIVSLQNNNFFSRLVVLVMCWLENIGGFGKGMNKKRKTRYASQ